MTKLMPLYIFVFILVFVSDRLSLKEYDQNGNVQYVKKEKILYFIAALSLAVFVGLRTWYNDTNAYKVSFQISSSNLADIFRINWLEIGNNPGYNAMMILLKHLNFSSQSYLMFYALLTNLIYLWFIRKYSDNILLSLFLFVTMGNYVFTMAALKQSAAIAFCLIAVDRCIEKKYFSFIIFVIIGTLFHAYSLMFFITPFLIYKPWSIQTFVLLALFGIAGFGLKSLLGTLINVTTMFGEEYSVDTFSGDGVNIFRFAVVWSPILVSFVTRNYLQENQSKNRNVIFALSLFNAEIMFIALFGTANYFARLANYFLIFHSIALPTSIKGFNKSSKIIMTFVIVFCFIFYHYYELVLAYVSFDQQFVGITLIEYLKSLF